MNQEDEQILQTFFYVLSRSVDLKNLRSAKDFFTTSEAMNIDKGEFGVGLKKLGYEENSIHYEILMNKYKNFYDKSLINLNLLIQEYETYVEVEKQKSKKTGTNFMSNATSPGTDKLNAQSGFVINTNTPQSNYKLTNNSEKEMFGVTKYLNTPSNMAMTQEGNNFGNTQSNYLGATSSNINNNNNNIHIQDEDLGMPSSRRGNTTGNIFRKINAPVDSGRGNMSSFANNGNNQVVSFREGDMDNNTTSNFNNNMSGSNTRSNDDNLIYEPGLSKDSKLDNNRSSTTSRPPTFGQTSLGSNNIPSINKSNTRHSLTDKLANLDKKMLNELQENHSYIKLALYEKFNSYYNTQQAEMEGEIRKRTRSDKFLTLESFEDFLDTCLVLSDDEKKILMMDIVTNKEGKFSSEDFLEKVKKFDKNELKNQIRNYNLNYNDYIVNLRNHFRDNGIDVKKSWISVFKSNPKADFNGFFDYLDSIGLNYSDEEVDYIFEKISEDNNIIIFKNFEMIMNRNPPSRESLRKIEEEKLSGVNFKNRNASLNKGGKSADDFGKNAKSDKSFTESPSIKPSSKKDSVRDAHLFNELKNKSTQESMAIVYQRLQMADNKIMGILAKMQNFKIFKIYESLHLIFRNYGNYAQTLFWQADMKKQGLLTDSDFNMVLTKLNLNLTEEQRDLILLSLTKTGSMYSYQEFLTKVTMYNGNDLFEWTRKAKLFYNDYVEELRDHIKVNKIDVNVQWEMMFKNASMIDFNQFMNLLGAIDFSLSHTNEFKHLFQILADDGVNLSLAGFRDLMIMDPPEVEDFIDSGSLTKAKEKSALSWKNKLQNFTEEYAKTYQKNYKNLTNIFRDINNKIKAQNTDIVKFFEDADVTPNGEIDKSNFIFKLITKLGIIKDVNFHTLLQTFTINKTEMVNLVGFLNAYFSFYYQDREAMVLAESKRENKNNDKNANANKTNQTNSQVTSGITEEVVFKNHLRSFTQEDMDYIEEVVNYLADIVLSEKNIGIKDFFNSKDKKKVQYFTRNEFIKILYEDLEIDTEGESDQLLILYDFLTNDNTEENKAIGFEPIKIDRILKIFKQYSEKGIEKTANKTSNNLQNTTQNNNTQNNFNKTSPQQEVKSKEDKILEEFSHYLNNNRIKFTTIFPVLESSPGENQIQLFEFKQAFTLCSFPIAHEDIELLIKYFDPYGRQRISLDSIKGKIKLYEPEYFEKPFQFIDQNKVNRNVSLIKEVNKNPHILNALNIINDHIQKNKLTVDEFFKSFDKDEDAAISKAEFMEILLKISDKFSIEQLEDVFNVLDRDRSDSVTIREFHAQFSSAIMTSEERKEKVKISNKMVDEINSLFNHFDKDKDDKISKDDFYKALKSVNNRTTMEDVNIIMKQVDKDGNNIVDRKEFFEVMENHLRQQIVIQEEEREYVIKLFKEEDVDKVNYLTPVQLKHLLKEKLKCDLTDLEMEELINEVDENNDGMIDIDEFIKLLESAEKNDNLTHTVRQINMKRKINPMTFLSIFSGLPMNFMPSFIKDEQKLFRLLPSATLKPRTDQTGILFEDILPLNSNASSGSFTLRPIPTKINAKISFDVATGVAIPDENVLNREQNIVGRILKVALFNSQKNKFFGNAVQIEAKWNKNYEDRWYFEEDRELFNNNILIRYNGTDFEYVMIVFEFVILIKKENTVTETSCGWSSIDVKELLRPCELKLAIKGGSPVKYDTISKTDIRSKRTGWAKFAQMFKGDVKSQLPVKIKPFKDLNNQDKQMIDYLPSCIVIHRAALQLCATYRKFIAKQILNNQFYSLKVIKHQHPIINNFCKIVDCPDAFRPMVEFWKLIIIESATNSEKKDENYWEFNLLDFVNRIYTVLYSEKFVYNELEPTKLALGDPALSSIRNLLINSAIKHDKGKKFNKNTVVEPVENLTSFKPFSIDECITTKIDIISKLDEIAPINERSVSYDLNKSGLDITR